MMRNQGLTLFELLLTLAILSLLLSIGIPSFTQAIHNNQTQSATSALIDAIESARSLAVMRNQRSLLLAQDSWENGWALFIDSNSNGVKDQNEQVLSQRGALSGVKISANGFLQTYVSFIGTGEGRSDSESSNAGAFLAGSIKVCPTTEGKGYKLILSRGGRLRTENLSSEDCEAI